MRVRGYVLLANIAAALLGGCTTVNLSAPISSNIGGDALTRPDPADFRGQPVVQLTFVSDVHLSAQAQLLDAYMTSPFQSGQRGHVTDADVANYTTAQTNLNAMMAKNTFYAFQLAKYLKMTADGDYALILNPVALMYAPARGFFYQPFEDQMPPYDVEINFLAYVHPNTQPSTKGEVITTHGESLAPIVSVRVDPQFNLQTGGAIALSQPMVRYAHDPDGRGVRGQLIDYLNGLHKRVPNTSLADKAQGSGALEPGRFYELDVSTFALSLKPPPDAIVASHTRAAFNYDPGTYDPFEFFDGYRKIILAALHLIDNSQTVTEAQRNYWRFYEDSDLANVMLQASDRSKRSFLMGAKTAELTYLSNQNDNWMDAVLDTQNFRHAFNDLRNAEQQARQDYVNSEIRRGVGVVVAILGVVAAASNNDNPSATALGGAAAGFGISMVLDATDRIDTIDENFELAYQSSYETQKAYVFETAEGERVAVVGRDYADFKQNIRARYAQKYQPAGTGAAAPGS